MTYRSLEIFFTRCPTVSGLYFTSFFSPRLLKFQWIVQPVKSLCVHKRDISEKNEEKEAQESIEVVFKEFFQSLAVSMGIEIKQNESVNIQKVYFVFVFSLLSL